MNNTSKEFKIFHVNNKVFVFVCRNGKMYEADEKAIKALYHDTEGKAEILENTDGIKEKIIEERIKTDDVGMLSLLVIQGCNLRCTYCYGDGGQYQDSGIMDFDTARNAVDYLLHKSNRNRLTICFFGGEPLLNFPLIKKVVEYCHKETEDSEKIINFSMTTNGTLLTPEIEEFIINNRIGVQISLDGDRDTQNKNRFDANGNGSYDVVVEKTKRLRELGCLGVRATLTPYNTNVIKIYEHLESLNFQKIIISPAFNMLTEDDYKKVIKSYIEWFRYLEGEIKKGNYKYVKKAKQFIQELQKIDRAIVRTAACGVGRNLLAIDIHGNAFPCQRFVAMKEFCIGNLATGLEKQEKFLEKVNKTINEKCEDCWCRNLCASGCSYCNVESTGDMKKTNETYCEYVKATMEELIRVYLQLKEEEKKILL